MPPVPSPPVHIVLLLAVVAPLAALLALVSAGVSFGAAVCAVFVITFVTTTAIEIRSTVQHRARPRLEREAL